MKWWCLMIIAAVFFIIAYNTRAADERWGRGALVCGSESSGPGIGREAVPVPILPRRAKTPGGHPALSGK